jgi:hypothetical protein
MNKIHPEFAFQSRELGAQIEDTLGDPPNKKYLAKVIKSLIDEYAKGSEMDDVNLLSFALADYLSFDDPAGLLAQSAEYDKGDAAKVLEMVSARDIDANKALTTVSTQNPELARKAIITAFLFKNRKRWSEEDQPQEEIPEDNFDDGDEEDQLAPGQEMINLFDSRGDGND